MKPFYILTKRLEIFQAVERQLVLAGNHLCMKIYLNDTEQLISESKILYGHPNKELLEKLKSFHIDVSNKYSWWLAFMMVNNYLDDKRIKSCGKRLIAAVNQLRSFEDKLLPIDERTDKQGQMALAYLRNVVDLMAITQPTRAVEWKLMTLMCAEDSVFSI